MIRQAFLLCILIAAAVSLSARAQVPLEELTSPYKDKTCSDLESADNVIENAMLAFTGRVIKREGDYTWFRIYVIHGGVYNKKIIKTGGFEGGRHFIAGSGQSYEIDGVYTVAVRGPETQKEQSLDAKYFNAMDKCAESLVSKAHERYGNYRVEKEYMTPDIFERIADNLFFYKSIYAVIAISLAALIICGFINDRERLAAFLKGSKEKVDKS